MVIFVLRKFDLLEPTFYCDLVCNAVVISVTTEESNNFFELENLLLSLWSKKSPSRLIYFENTIVGAILQPNKAMP